MSRRLRPFLLSGTLMLVGFAGVALAQSSTTPIKTQDRLPLQSETAAGPFQHGTSDLAPAAWRHAGIRMAAIDAGPFAEPEDEARAGPGPQFAYGPQGGPGRRPGPPPPPDAEPGDPEEAGPEFGPPPRFPFPGHGMPGRGMPGPRGSEGPRGPLGYASTLAAAEVALGIQAGQLDAWRAFTDALQAAVMPPLPPPPAGAEPPSPVAALAGRLAAQGEAGSRLTQATQALREKLRPDQLTRLAALEPELVPTGGPRRPPPGRRSEAGGPERPGDGPGQGPNSRPLPPPAR